MWGFLTPPPDPSVIFCEPVWHWFQTCSQAAAKAEHVPEAMFLWADSHALKKGGGKKEQHTKHDFFCLAGKQNEGTIYRSAGQYNPISFSSAVTQLHLNYLLHNGLTTDTGDTDHASTDPPQQQLRAQGGNASAPQNLAIPSSAVDMLLPLHLHPSSRLRDVSNLAEKLAHLGLPQKEDSKSSEQAQISSVQGLFPPCGFNCQAIVKA